MGDDVPRLSCPDLAAAMVRWQQVWEDRDEAGAKVGLVLSLLLHWAHSHHAAIYCNGNQARRHRGSALGVCMHGQTGGMQWTLYPSKAAGWYPGR